MIRAGRCFMRAGEAGREVVIILSGIVSVHAPSSGRYLTTLDRGEVCGEVSVLTGGLRRADVVANTDTMIAVMSRGEFSAWLADDSSFAEAVSAQMYSHTRDH